MIDSFQKTNGQRFEADGASAYRLFYTAHVTFPRGYRPECVSNSGEFRGFNCAMATSQGGLRPREAGAAVIYSGEVVFQDTERGWVPSHVSLSESSAPPASARPIGIANPGSDRLKGLSPLNQRIGLQRAIRGNRKPCSRVIAGAYQEQYGERAMWVALCEDGRHWAVYISPNQNVEVRDCAEAEQLRLPVCHPVQPMPHDPTAAPGTEVPANQVEAANRNLTNAQ